MPAGEVGKPSVLPSVLPWMPKVPGTSCIMRFLASCQVRPWRKHSWASFTAVATRQSSGM